MNKVNIDRTLRRKRRIRNVLFGSKTKPRVSVHRSNKYIYVQAIDDEARKTIIGYSSLQAFRKDKSLKSKKSEQAKSVGVEFAKLLLKENIKTCVFDRSTYAYKGRVKAVAEGLREGGIKV